MPTKRTFDLVIIAGLLLHPAVGLFRIASRRWVRENNDALAVIGSAAAVAGV